MMLFRSTIPFVLFSALILSVGFFVVIGETQAASTPPPEAQCNGSNQIYECKGAHVGVLLTINGATNIPPLECFGACQDSGGSILSYNETRAKDNYYCYGATEDKTCEFSGETISVIRGVLTETEVDELPKECKSGLLGIFDTGCLLDKILRALGSLGGTLIVSVLGIISSVLGFLFFKISELLGWTIGNITSITVSPNHPQTVQIVKDGWQISRDIANMFFIIVLSFIGLATILGIESYQAKKTLPRLIIIALLMNFSGVLVGFIVDIGNLLANFFLQKAVGLSWAFEWPGVSSSSSEILQKAAGHITRIVFYMVASLIYLAVAFLFFVRVFFLWTITILAPLAFAAYILPATKKYWTEWWNQLIQWSILGVPMAFFIYLSRLALEPTVQGSLKGVGGGANPIASFMGPFVALFLLFFGISLSMSLAPDAAKRSLEFGKKTGAGLGLKTGAGLWRRFEGKDIKEGGGRISKFGTALSRLETAPKDSGALRRSVAGGLKYSRLGLITRLAGRDIEIASKEATMRVADKDVREQNAGTEEVGSRDSFAIFNKINQELAKPGLKNWNRVTGLLNGIRNRGDGDDIEDAVNQGILKKEIIGKAIKTGLRTGPPGFRPLLKSFYGGIMTNPKAYGFDAEVEGESKNHKVIEKSGRDAKILEGFQNSIPAKFNTKDFEGDTLAKANFDPKTEEGRYFLKNIVEQRDADFMAALARRPDKEERDSLMKYIFEEMYGSKDATIEKLAINAPGALRYISSTAARGLGLGVEDLTPEKVEEIIKNALKKARERGPEEGLGGIGPRPRQSTGGPGGSSETPSDRKPTGGSKSSKKEGPDSSPGSERRPI